MSYRAPVTEFGFVLEHVVDFKKVQETDRFADAQGDVVAAILAEAGKVATEKLAPLQRIGDMRPAHLENGVVRTSPGFAEGFRAISEGGWIGVTAPPEHGGLGLPLTLSIVVNEMMAGACMALQLNPMLTQAQIHALEVHGDADIQKLYLPHLISGNWAGTMNLSEPQAGSDVGALRSRAEPDGEGTYRISGQKIYISWGDSDFCENICHMVLARLPDAPSGSRGISLFLVPKFIPRADGTLGPANSLKVVSLEHKLGLHGSPTAVMEFDAAKGWLIGEPHKGLATMFTMMNNARLNTGVQGIGVAEAGCQIAESFAKDRRQGRTGRPLGTIIEHADVRRMLVSMRAETFAARAIGLACAVAIDMETATGQDSWRARAAFLTPIAKAFGTDTGHSVAQDAIQVHGGMGYIEETGVAQLMRDVRVTQIYEGTNGIQAMDLVSRKLMDDGDAAFALLDEIEDGAEAARARFPDVAQAVWTAAEALREATEWMVAQGDMDDRFAGAVPYLRAFARVLGGHYHLRAAMAEDGAGPRADLCRAYVTRLLPQHAALLAEAQAGAADLFAIKPEVLGA
ncbi:MAG: acyl-CoA dehydrogenase [Rhodobacteraceae bacterium]|nr:acyl-CoA dehydrogenase [Alphaproteobacteria bacterium]NNK68167.1 acyl-CoA dehydrogenase [Paracoccaceae bacterium]